MKYGFKKALLFSAIIALPTVSLANIVPINVIPNVKYKSALPTETIVNVVKNQIQFAPEISSARVQVIYKDANKPDHLLVYMISGKNYSLKISKIDVNDNYQPLSVTADYHLQKIDKEQQPFANLNKKDLSCPDDTVEIFAGTAFDYVPTAVDVVNNITQHATDKGYVAKSLLGSAATTADYLNYLSCPNLKGYFNVGAGDSTGFMVDDGFISNEDISSNFKDKLNNTVVLFNSGTSFWDPLKSSLTKDAKAQRYAGGLTGLFIGPSEATSLCFWDSAFAGDKLTPALILCNIKLDPNDIFWISGQGPDILNPPNTK